MGEEFKPTLALLAGFEGKVKADYNEFTQYLTLVLAENGKMVSFNGIVEDQVHVDVVVGSMLRALGKIENATNDVVDEIEKPKKKK